MMTGKDQMHPDDRRNLVIFLAAALAIWFSFDHFVMKPRLEKMRAAQAIAAQVAEEKAINLAAGIAAPTTVRSRTEVLAEATRIPLRNDAVTGSMALTGNRIDDISLNKYVKTLGGKDNVILLEPTGTENP